MVAHNITVTVNETDNSTALEGALVYVRNTTKRTSSEEKVTDSSGQVTIDLDDLPVAPGQTDTYNDGDFILIIAYHGNTSDAATYEVTGSSHSETLNMNHALHRTSLTSEKIRTLIVANEDSTNAQTATVYAVDDAQVLAHIICPSEDTKIAYLEGLSSGSGYAIVRSSTDVTVTTILK